MYKANSELIRFSASYYGLHPIEVRFYVLLISCIGYLK